MADFLLDTNVLLRMLQPDSPQRQESIRAVTSLRSQGEMLYVTPQVLIEFWAVATRPVEANGFGWDPEAAASQVDGVLQQFPLLEDNPAVFANWLELVRSLGIRGKQVHDARLIAVMQAYDISQLVSFDTEDFAVYPGITVVHPQDIP